MSKFVADKVYRMTNEAGDLIVSFVVQGYDKRVANMACEELKGLDKLSIEVKQYHSKRSLEQNRLLWSLLGKLAEAMSGSKDKVSSEEAYCIMLEQANVKADYMLALPEAEPMIKQCFRVVRKVGERTLENGKTLNMYQYFVGTSKYDTKQMTDFINAVINKLAELGVVDSEIESVRGMYEDR